MAVSDGVLTGAGRGASHASFVALELSKPRLVRCEGLELDLMARTARAPRAPRIGTQLLYERDGVCLARDAVVTPNKMLTGV